MSSVIDELERLGGLLDRGLVSREEFEAEKARLLSRSSLGIRHPIWMLTTVALGLAVAGLVWTRGPVEGPGLVAGTEVEVAPSPKRKAKPRAKEKESAREKEAVRGAEPVADEPEATPPAPKPAAPAPSVAAPKEAVVVDKATVTGSLDGAAVDRVVATVIGDLGRCWEEEQAFSGAQHAELVVKFTVYPDGIVPAAAIWAQTGSSEELDRCASDTFVGLQMPPPDGGVAAVKVRMRLGG